MDPGLVPPYSLGFKDKHMALGISVPNPGFQMYILSFDLPVCRCGGRKLLVANGSWGAVTHLAFLYSFQGKKAQPCSWRKPFQKRSNKLHGTWVQWILVQKQVFESHFLPLAELGCMRFERPKAEMVCRGSSVSVWRSKWLAGIYLFIYLDL